MIRDDRVRAIGCLGKPRASGDDPAVVDAAARAGTPMVLVWHLTEEMPPGPAHTLGATWWRAVAAAAQERVPGIAIGYAAELDGVAGSRDRTLSEAIGPSVLPPPR